MTKETNVIKLIQLTLTNFNCRVFRNNTGKAWQGNTKQVTGTKERSMLIENPRIINFGLCEGSSDLIGWTSIKITPEHIGRKIAVFTAIEAKKAKTSKASNEQQNFIKAVLEAGGYAGLANNPDAALNIISKLPM